MNKICTKCGETKVKTEFGSNKSKKDGLQTWCRSCVKTYNKTYYVNTPERNDQRIAWKEKNIPLLQDYVWNYLLDNPCVDCGESDPIVLEFDHLHSKEFTIGNYIHKGGNLERLKDEIAKCDVRCANCHRRITAARGSHWRHERFMI